jgi:hypothetical protein
MAELFIRSIRREDTLPSRGIIDWVLPHPRKRTYWIYGATVLDAEKRVIWSDNGRGRENWESFIRDGVRIARAVTLLEGRGIQVETWEDAMDRADS